MRLISSLYPSSWELKHAYSAEEAVDLVKQHFDSKQMIEGIDHLRSFLMLNFDSEVLKQVEKGEWLLIKPEAYYFDWAQFDKAAREQRVFTMMQSPPPQKKRPIQVFRVVDSETGEPVLNRKCVATVDGQKNDRRVDGLGVTHIYAPPENAKISMQLIFGSPPDF